MDVTCDICGSTEVQEIKCKVICRNCGTILKSCADLEARDVPIPPCAAPPPDGR